MFFLRSPPPALRHFYPRFSPLQSHAYTTTAPVKIVEVGPRDGLQNEPGASVPVATKVALINRLARTGLTVIEAGSFVSPKWVPQMAGTADVVSEIERPPGVCYQVLVPNQRGLADYLSLRSSSPSLPPDEIAVFAAATESFSRANTNVSVKDSLVRLAEVARVGINNGLKVRGYVSVVDTCPYEGRVNPVRVREVTKELVEMGCYEVSLGDTTGTGTPASIRAMIEEVMKTVSVDRLAGHFHDTFGTAVANVFAALSLGIRTIDASVGGLGGCPYSPGATGNVATEDVLYALHNSPEYTVAGNVNLEEVAEIGWWVCGELGRESGSRAGKALRSRMIRREKETEKEKAKL